MLYVDNRNVTDPRLNLALEEHVLRNRITDDSCLLFYVNAPSIIVGRNQNTIEEINPAFVDARGIQVVRRISGGGAVYHDLGNLNFSVTVPYAPNRFNRYEEFTRPVVEVLRDLGVPAEVGGRNDILADGRKISGNAQFATPTRMFSHGTLLLDSNLDDVTSALQVKPAKIESKGVKSVRSRVANIREFLREPLAVEELRERIIERIFGTRDRARIPTLELTEHDWNAARELVARKYGSWHWNYGENPACNVQRAQRFPAGEIDVRIDVQQGHVAALRIFGDFMGRTDVAQLEQRLHGVRYDRATIATALGGLDLREYFGDVNGDDLLTVLCG
ncbi:MAG TPA: lipoate--protein ligase [Gemmatimonadaceae bacterium]|nr:lipoate--protein ligase [Gemmatimonadaceae bacterium]